MDNNNVYLLSNGSTEYFTKNSLTSFVNKIPIPFEFTPNDKWEVGVKSFGLSTIFCNVTAPSNPVAPSLIVTDCWKNLGLSQCVIKDGVESVVDSAVKQSHTCEHMNDITFRKQNEICDAWDYFIEEKKVYHDDDIKKLCETIQEQSKMIAKFENGVIEFTVSDAHVATNHHYWVWMHKTFLESFGFNFTYVSGTPITHQNRYTKVHKVRIGNKVYNQRVKRMRGETYYLYVIAKKIEGDHVLDTSMRSVKFDLGRPLYPKYIKMVCDSIQPQILNSEYSKDLMVFSPDYIQKGVYVYKDIESVDYVPLLNTYMTDIHIKLLDEHNNQLKLHSGHATIVKLGFRKMPASKQSFNVRLTSVKSKNFDDNDQFKFRVKLPSPITLDNKWKVCLNSISHPTKFSTFLPEESEDKMRRIVFISHDHKKFEMNFNKHWDYSAHSLVSSIDNDMVKHNLGKCELVENKVNFHFDILGILTVHEEMAALLGLVGNVEDSHIHFEIGTHAQQFKHYPRSVHPINIDHFRPNYVMMYSNIVKSSIVAGNYTKILKIFPLKKADLDYTITEFKTKEFYELENNEIDVIEIQLRAHDGRFINFKPGQDIIANLEFSNYTQESL